MARTYTASIDKLTEASYRYLNNTLALLAIFILLRLFDAFVLVYSFNFTHDVTTVHLKGLLFDVYVVLKIAGYLIIPYLLLYMLRKSIAEVFFIVAGCAFILISLSLQLYFATTKIPLGADLYTYNLDEMREILSSTNSFSLVNFIPFAAFPILFISLRHYIMLVKLPNIGYYIFYTLELLVFITSGFSIAPENNFGGHFNASVASNKLGFFTLESLSYFKEQDRIHKAQNTALLSQSTFIAERLNPINKNYPFLRKDETPNVLGPFFANEKLKPNVVIILVESLGRAYSGKGAELGSFTPFLDSLSEHSLYFENFLSTAGRTFAVLPSVLGSLPFNVHGFSDMGEKMPQHNTILKYLIANGYNAYFVYGGDSKFDNMSMFMHRQGVSNIIDIHDSWGNTKQLPPNDRGFSWGYGDMDMLQRVVDVFKNNDSPTVAVALTVAMHDPFRVPNEANYKARFHSTLQRQPIDDSKKQYLLEYNNQLATVLYFDDALKLFFKEFSKLPQFKNTIFLITGDHRMPEIPIATAIDRFRVPLVIYSPMLKRSARFSSISTQFDISPSLAALLKNMGDMQFPHYAAWIGDGLDTLRKFRNIHSVPFMENKNGQTTFIEGLDFISGGKLYTVTPNLTLKDNNNIDRYEEIQKQLDEFKAASVYVSTKNRIIPDSIVLGGKTNKR